LTNSSEDELLIDRVDAVLRAVRPRGIAPWVQIGTVVVSLNQTDDHEFVVSMFHRTFVELMAAKNGAVKRIETFQFHQDFIWRDKDRLATAYDRQRLDFVVPWGTALPEGLEVKVPERIFMTDKTWRAPYIRDGWFNQRFKGKKSLGVFLTKKLIEYVRDGRAGLL
jgi:hypothetical protein